LQPGVRDPVFAALVAFVMNDGRGELTRADLVRTVEASGRRTKLPVGFFDRVIREPGLRPLTADVVCDFTGDIHEAVPYSILGYHPGSLRSTRHTVWREWLLGSVSVPYRDGEEARSADLEDVRLWALVEGEIWLDIDAFVDRLLGPKLDDTRVTGLLLFREKGRLCGMAVGYNRKGEGHSGALSLDDDAVRFPSPGYLRVVARTMRARMEGMLEIEKRRAERGTR
jgi:hypothetical protein